jgi:hypothetical protein
MSQISGNKTNVTTICNMGVLVWIVEEKQEEIDEI